jgi:hypothetical protein
VAQVKKVCFKGRFARSCCEGGLPKLLKGGLPEVLQGEALWDVAFVLARAPSLPEVDQGRGLWLLLLADGVFFGSSAPLSLVP